MDSPTAPTVWGSEYIRGSSVDYFNIMRDPAHLNFRVTSAMKEMFPVDEEVRLSKNWNLWNAMRWGWKRASNECDFECLCKSEVGLHQCLLVLKHQPETAKIKCSVKWVHSQGCTKDRPQPSASNTLPSLLEKAIECFGLVMAEGWLNIVQFYNNWTVFFI